MGSLDKLPPYPENASFPCLRSREKPSKTSRCQIFAFFIAAILIVMDLATTILVQNTRDEVNILRDELKIISENTENMVRKRYPVDSESVEIKELRNLVIPSTVVPEYSINPKISASSISDPEFQIQTQIVNSRLSIEEADDFYSDGGNDKPPLDTNQICLNAKSEFGFDHESSIFYTFFRPTSKFENPDIAAIHLADHTTFSMRPNFAGRLSPNISDFDLQNRKTLIYVHGFRSNSYAKSSLLKQLFTETDEYNLIIMDWRVLAEPKTAGRSRRQRRGMLDYAKQYAFNTMVKSMGNYPTAFKNRHLAARELYYLLEMILNQIPATDIHIVGHSLGAHVAGEASFYLTKNTGTKIGRITGLDPAKICFTETDDIAMQKQLSKEKADFVDVWHTSANLASNSAGLARPAGHVDYWINGGKFQPICKIDQGLNDEMGIGVAAVESIVNGGVSPCSHGMVEQYFIDSLRRCHGKGGENGFRAFEIERTEIFEYQHDGLGEVEMNFSRNSSRREKSFDGVFMGFWTDKQVFEERLESCSKSGSESGSGVVENIVSSDTFVNEHSSEIIQMTDILEPNFGKYQDLWSESKNFVVFTKNTRNPNIRGQVETQLWNGYCEDEIRQSLWDFVG